MVTTGIAGQPPTGPVPRHLASLQSRIADHPDFVHRPEDRAILDLGRIQPAPKLRDGWREEASPLADAGLIGLAPPDQGRTRTAVCAPQIVQSEGDDLATTGQQVAHGQHQSHVADVGKVGSGGGKDLGDLGATERRRLAPARAEAPSHALERQAYRLSLGWVGQAGRTVQGCKRPGQAVRGPLATVRTPFARRGGLLAVIVRPATPGAIIGVAPTVRSCDAVRLLSNLLTRFIHNGEMRLTDATGRLHVFGQGAPGPRVAIRLSDKALHTRLAFNPELYAGEAYMDGTLTFEEGSDVGDLVTLFAANRSGLAGHTSQKFLRRVLGADALAPGEPGWRRRRQCAPALRPLDRPLQAFPGRRAELLLRLF